MEERITGLQQELAEVRQSRGGNDYGLVRLSNAQSITDSRGIALPASENNAAVEGTLANRIKKNSNSLGQKRTFYTSLQSLGITSTFIPDIIDAMPANTTFAAVVNGTGIYENADNKIPGHAGTITIERIGGYTRTLFTHSTSGSSKGTICIASVNTNTKEVVGWYEFSGTKVT